MNEYQNRLPALLLMAGLSFASTTSATLFVRAGGMVYDSDLNITWLQDANYAQTSGYDFDGKMNWTTAKTWADSLTFGGYTDWRLPTIIDTGTPGCDFSYNGTDCGYNSNPATSELAHVFFVELGDLSSRDTTGNIPVSGGISGVDWGVVHTGPFTNLQNWVYWSGTEYAPSTGDAWGFVTQEGQQGGGGKGLANYAWAVRDGDVSAAVPEPRSLTLLGVGLAAWIGGLRRRRG